VLNAKLCVECEISMCDKHTLWHGFANQPKVKNHHNTQFHAVHDRWLRWNNVECTRQNDRTSQGCTRLCSRCCTCRFSLGKSTSLAHRTLEASSAFITVASADVPKCALLGPNPPDHRGNAPYGHGPLHSPGAGKKCKNSVCAECKSFCQGTYKRRARLWKCMWASSRHILSLCRLGKLGGVTRKLTR
jgi:hypothetical protein